MRLKVSQAMEVRLGRQRAPQFEEGDHLVPYLRSANIENGRLSLGDVKEMNFTPAEQEIFSLHPGDVLVTEGSGSADAVGASAVWSGEINGPVCFQNTLLRLRPRPGVTDGRYLAWWARHAHGARQFSAVATGASIQHLGSEGIKQLELDVPDLDEQRRIADFLDDQVARIDSGMACRKDQKSKALELANARVVYGLLEGGRQDRTSPWFRGLPEATSLMTLRSCWTVIDCKHRTPEYLDAGYPVVSPGDVSPGILDVSTCTRFVGEEDFLDLADSLRRCVAGDIVYSRNASAGIAAYVSDERPFTMGQDVCRITSRDHSQRYLSHVLNFIVQPQLEAARVGSTFTRINVDQIKALVIPVPRARQGQEILADRVDEILLWRDQLEVGLEESIRLLQEYKRSLISAAVSGEFDVATASGRALPTV